MWLSKKQLIIIALACFIATGVVAVSAAAQTEYKLLAPLPQGDAGVSADATGLTTYLAQLFWFLLSAAVILALVMLIIGGVAYVGSAGNTSILGDAKSRMTNALLGILLALSAWLILNLINPDLVDFSLPIKAITSSVINTTFTPNTPPLYEY